MAGLQCPHLLFMLKYRYIYFETDAVLALYLFPAIYMSFTGIKGGTQWFKGWFSQCYE